MLNIIFDTFVVFYYYCYFGGSRNWEFTLYTLYTLQCNNKDTGNNYKDRLWTHLDQKSSLEPSAPVI